MPAARSDVFDTIELSGEIEQLSAFAEEVLP